MGQCLMTVEPDLKVESSNVVGSVLSIMAQWILM